MLTNEAIIDAFTTDRGRFTVRRDGALLIGETATRRVYLNDPTIVADAREAVPGMLTDAHVIRAEYVADLAEWAIRERGWTI